jgi:hypothetical protein
MKKIFMVLIILAFMTSVALCDMTHGGDNYVKNRRHALSCQLGVDPIYDSIDEVEGIVNDANLDEGTMVYFDAGGYVYCPSIDRVIFGNGTEDIQIIFGTDIVTLNSSTGVVTFDFNSVVPKTSSLTVGSTTYTLPASDGTNGQLLKTNGSKVLSWTSAGAGSVTDLDTAYNGGVTITVDAGAITATATDAANNAVLSLVQLDTGAQNGLVIQNAAGTGNLIDLTGNAGSKDIDGTSSTWYVTSAGTATLVSVAASGALSAGTTVTSGTGGFVLTNGAIITNATDTEILFTEDNGTAAENLSLDFLVNEVDLKSTTGIATIGFGDLDDFTGLNNLTFDAVASTINLPADSAGDDLTISVSNTQDASLVLSSAGTAEDALEILTTGGGINILANAEAGEDIDIYSTGSSVNITSTESVENAVVITASGVLGGIDVTAQGDIDVTSVNGSTNISITNGTAGKDISIDNVGGSINIEATESIANAILIHSSGAAGGITIDYNTGDLVITGTGASADFTVNCDLFSIDGTGTSNITVTSNADAEDFTIALAGTQNSSLILSSTGTAEDALQITASAGGINMSSTTDPIDITVNADGTADDLTLNVVGAQDASIIASSAGTGVDAIKLNATAGGVDIDGKDDVTINCASTTTGDNLTINQTGATQSGIFITATGTGPNSISLQTLAGGMDVDAKDDIIITCASTTTGDDFRLIQTGAFDASISLEAAGTGADAISLVSSAGGTKIQAIGATDGDILISAGDDVNIVNVGQVDFSGNATQDFVIRGTDNQYETTVRFTDPTADIVYTFPTGTVTPVAVMTSTLATNAPDAANSVYGVSNGLTFEGATADGNETTLSPQDPTADNTVTIPDDGGILMTSTLATNGQGVANSVWGVSNGLTFEGGTADAFNTTLTVTDPTTPSKTITLPNVTGTVLLSTSAIRTLQQYVQTISYCKVGATAGWVIPAAADAAHVAALPASQTASTLIIPIMIPLKVGYTITGWTINGQIDSEGNAAILDARLYKHTEDTTGFANATVGAGMSQLSKTGDYKVVEGVTGLTEVVAADESFYLLVTGTTNALTDIEIASITVTVSEL